MKEDITQQENTQSNSVNRREFMGFTFAAAVSGLLMPEVVSDVDAQVSGAFCTAQVGQELVNPGEITSSNGTLEGILDLSAEKRAVTYFVPGPADTCPPSGPVPNSNYVCGFHTLRAYHGYKGYSLDGSAGVTPKGVAYPGPTLRASVGDTVQLILLNRIDPSQFNYSSQISMAPGMCDSSVSVATGGNAYPGTDKFPDCFHVSNTTNIHFHGTHTDPGNFGDNVLAAVLPNHKQDVRKTIELCRQAYALWKQGKNPTPQLVAAANTTLKQMYQQALAARDMTLASQLDAAIKANQNNTAHGEFPQYWPGYYPHHLELPVFTGGPNSPLMGQAPGTHWYHCHQHGSTTLQLLNGMAGTLIVSDLRPGGYDASILSLGGGTPTQPKIKEKVIVMQLFNEQPNRINQAAPGLTVSPTATVTVNGQITPKITMKKGEVQWWRLVDATMKAHGIEQFLFIDSGTYQNLMASPCQMLNGQPPTVTQTLVPELRQIAQDGVQFAWPNYYRFYKNAAQRQYTFNVAPGNRMDFLIKAPATEGTAYLVFWPPASPVPRNVNGGPPSLKGGDLRQVVVLSVEVKGDPDANTNTAWFDSNDPNNPPAGYPAFPAFLADLPQPNISRKVTFSMQGGPGSQPMFFIDGKQFSEGHVDQTMAKDTVEEWTVVNTSLNSIMHPFHIHINPFQITHYYDPNDPTTNQNPLPQPWVWSDTKPIPAAKINAEGSVTPGYFKMRSRFADFVGKYVIHCHILGHEDRGMMQLVQVVDNATVVHHH
jgi:FtsP/CotA-like multicopper oxidase with cupredoxin domain